MSQSNKGSWLAGAALAVSMQMSQASAAEDDRLKECHELVSSPVSQEVSNMAGKYAKYYVDRYRSHIKHRKYDGYPDDYTGTNFLASLLCDVDEEGDALIDEKLPELQKRQVAISTDKQYKNFLEIRDYFLERDEKAIKEFYSHDYFNTQVAEALNHENGTDYGEIVEYEDTVKEVFGLHLANFLRVNTDVKGKLTPNLSKNLSETVKRWKEEQQPGF